MVVPGGLDAIDVGPITAIIVITSSTYRRHRLTTRRCVYASVASNCFITMLRRRTH